MTPDRIKVAMVKNSKHFVEFYVLTGEDDENSAYVRSLLNDGGFVCNDLGRWDQLPRMARVSVTLDAHDDASLGKCLALLKTDHGIELQEAGSSSGTSGASPH